MPGNPSESLNVPTTVPSLSLYFVAGPLIRGPNGIEAVAKANENLLNIHVLHPLEIWPHVIIWCTLTSQTFFGFYGCFALFMLAVSGHGS